MTLIKAMADASQEHLAMWTRVDVVREVAGSLAMAVQRGNAMAFLDGYERVQAAALAQAEHAHRHAKDTKEDEKRRQVGPCTRPRRRTTAARRRAVRTRTSKAHIEGRAWARSQRRVDVEGSLSD